MRRYLLLPLAILLASLPAKAQVIEEFRPMYLITGIPLSGPVNVNVDASVSYHLGAIALFSQFYYGYGEALADWVRGSHPAPHLRVGVMLGNIL